MEIFYWKSTNQIWNYQQYFQISMKPVFINPLAETQQFVSVL